jgi:hypothetical protein
LFERLKGIKDDQDRGRVRLCFGSRKLFLAQFALKANGYEANGYKDHSDWKADWLQSRSSQFFVLASKDEIAGDQSCTAMVEEKGTLTLRLRLLLDLHGATPWRPSLALLFAERLGQPTQFSGSFVHGYGNG